MTPAEFAQRLVDNVATATQLDPEKGELANVEDWRRNAESLFAFATGAKPTTVQWRGSVEALAHDLRAIIPPGEWVKFVALFVPRDAAAPATSATFQGDPLPEPRTPETVLRAMLRAYEAEWIALEADLLRRSMSDDGNLIGWPGGARLRQCAEDVLGLRRGLILVLAGGLFVTKYFGGSLLGADYQARLAGTRPLDAPPMETP